MRKTDQPKALIGCEFVRRIYHRYQTMVNRNRQQDKTFSRLFLYLEIALEPPR